VFDDSKIDAGTADLWVANPTLSRVKSDNRCFALAAGGRKKKVTVFSNPLHFVKASYLKMIRSSEYLPEPSRKMTGHKIRYTKAICFAVNGSFA
jgi:hypothetical protein